VGWGGCKEGIVVTARGVMVVRMLAALVCIKDHTLGVFMVDFHTAALTSG